MNRNRFHMKHLPRPTMPPPAPTAFLLCPVMCIPFVSPAQASWLQWLYNQALEQALEAARPSLPERDLLGHWN